MIIPNNIDFAAFAKLVGDKEAQEIHPADHWRKELQSYLKDGNVTKGSKLPWKITEGRFQIREGELTIYCGDNGHLKSMFLGQAFLGLAKTERCAIASMEMKPEHTLARMCRQAVGNSEPSESYIDKFMDWSHDRLFIYNQLDRVESSRVIGMVWYAAKELGCKHIMIDSFMQCGVPIDGPGAFTAQSDFINRLCWCAKTLNCHIHLVAHFRKRQETNLIGSRYDIAGSGKISDLAFNVAICWKNETRELARSKLKDGLALTDEEQHEIDEGRDFAIKIDKQRNDEFLGRLGFFLDTDSLQLMTRKGARPEIMEL